MAVRMRLIQTGFSAVAINGVRVVWTQRVRRAVRLSCGEGQWTLGAVATRVMSSDGSHHNPSVLPAVLVLRVSLGVR